MEEGEDYEVEANSEMSRFKMHIQALVLCHTLPIVFGNR